MGNRIVSVILALLAVIVAVLSGIGVGILLTHTYWSFGYSLVITIASAAGAWWLLHTARASIRKSRR